MRATHNMHASPAFKNNIPSNQHHRLKDTTLYVNNNNNASGMYLLGKK